MPDAARNAKCPQKQKQEIPIWQLTVYLESLRGARSRKSPSPTEGDSFY